jgi:transposase-like protein
MRGYSKASDPIERFELDLSNHRAFPMDHWKKIRTTNGLERINKELKRRSHAAYVKAEKLGYNYLVSMPAKTPSAAHHLLWHPAKT